MVPWRQRGSSLGVGTQRQALPVGCVKYVDLAFGAWKQICEFVVVEEALPAVSLGIDFLRKSQCVINFEAAHLLVGGSRGERVQLLGAKDIASLSRAALLAITSEL